jgi:hypothetical protein
MEGIEEAACARLFRRLRALPQSVQWSVRLRFFELVGKRVVDLLPRAATTAGPEDGRGRGGKEHELVLREDGEGHVVVCGAAEEPAADAAQLLRLMGAAKASRAVASTARNTGTGGAGGGGSSRSHAVCQVLVRFGRAASATTAAAAAAAVRSGGGRGGQAGAPCAAGGVLTLVDCAGTERKVG